MTYVKFCYKTLMFILNTVVLLKINLPEALDHCNPSPDIMRRLRRISNPAKLYDTGFFEIIITNFNG